MEIVSLELALENGEVVQVPRESIKYFSVDSVLSNGELTFNTPIKIIVDNLCELLYNDYDQFTSRNLPHERLLTHNDITQITMNYINGKEQTIHINWKDNEAAYNENQATELINNELYINIK